MRGALDFAFLGLSLRSAWGNGHATTYRGLLRALRRRGHRVRFYERERSWYADNQDLPDDLAPCLVLYDDIDSLRDKNGRDIATADVAVLGSFVPEGAQVADWLLQAAHGVTAFYDIDTPVTMTMLRENRCDYLRAERIADFDVYLSFTGGAFLDDLRCRYDAHAEPLYCAVDPEHYAPSQTEARYDLGYLGTYSADRQPLLQKYLLDFADAWPQGRFVVAGPQYPADIGWARNIERIEHLAPTQHRDFYTSQRFALNLTRSDMVAAGWSPSVRLFEAAACGVPIISDAWRGIHAFFAPDREILLAREPRQVLAWLRHMPEERRRALGAAARRRVLAEHTAGHRAQTLEHYIDRVVPRLGASRSSQVSSTRSVCHDIA
ncbi:MAG TPA: glycosyltransferase [Rhodanobacteraceae bacterium]